MKKWVDDILDGHEPLENALDAETGREYDRSLIEVRFWFNVSSDTVLIKPFCIGTYS